jgi:hypothetical protein
MSITTAEELGSHVKRIKTSNLQIVKESSKENDFQQLTVSTIIKTMLEIIIIKKNTSMDEETRKQFPAIAKEIIFLSEQAQ